MRKLLKVLIVIAVILIAIGIYAFIQYRISKDNVEQMWIGAEMMSNYTGPVVIYGEEGILFNLNASAGFNECNKTTYMNGACYILLEINMIRNNETVPPEFCESIPTDSGEPFWLKLWMRKHPGNFDFKTSCYELIEVQKNRTKTI